VNPNQPGCTFESKSIAGVGVMFYVLLALRAELRARGAV
jgi:single-stranded-DNA-specific exonuclease